MVSINQLERSGTSLYLHVYTYLCVNDKLPYIKVAKAA